jgi:hypothetical protein
VAFCREGAMHKLGVWGMAATLVLGLAVQGIAAAEDDTPEKPPEKPPETRNWWNWTSSRKEQPSPGKLLDDRIETNAAKIRAAEAAEKNREAKRRDEARRAWEAELRRQKVLDKLLQFAVYADDQQTVKRIEALKERSFAVFKKKTEKDVGAVSDASPTRSTDVAPVRGNGRKNTAGVE